MTERRELKIQSTTSIPTETDDPNANSPDAGGVIRKGVGDAGADACQGIRHVRCRSGKNLPQARYSRSSTWILAHRRDRSPGSLHLRCIAAKNGPETLDVHVRDRLPPELAALAAEPAAEIAIPGRSLPRAGRENGKAADTAGKRARKKLMVPKNGALAHLLVSREQMSRALRIMNALFLALEERGQSVSWPKEEEADVDVGCGRGDGQVLRVGDSQRACATLLTPAEQKHPWMAPKWDYKLTGKLQFRVDNLPYSAGVRGTWSDGKCQRLEKCIGDFTVGLRVAAAAIKKNRQETEERERRWEEERKQKEEQRRKAAEHKRKAEFVTELMRNWEEARERANVREGAGRVRGKAGTVR
jgi:hypothetical protein